MITTIKLIYISIVCHWRCDVLVVRTLASILLTRQPTWPMVDTASKGHRELATSIFPYHAVSKFLYSPHKHSLIMLRRQIRLCPLNFRGAPNVCGVAN